MVALIRVARVLAPAGYGYYNIVLTSGSIGLVFAGFGMRNVIVRACARNPEVTKSLYFSSLFVRMIISPVVGIGIMLYAIISPHVLPLSLSGFAILFLVGLILWDTTESISFGLQRMEFSSRTNVIGSAVWVLYVWCAPASLLTVAVMSFSFALLQISKAVLLGWQVQRVIPTTNRLVFSNLKKDALNLIKESIPFFWMMLLEMIQFSLPILILAQRSNPEQVGLFNVGFRMLRPLRLLLMTAISALYPYLSKIKVENPTKYLRVVESALKAALILGSTSIFIVFLFRVEVVNLLFGEKYDGSADAMAYQCLFLVLLGIQFIIGTSFLASDRQRLWAVLTTVFTIFTLPIVWFGADYGATGLAISMSIGVAISLFICWPFFMNKLPAGFKSRSIFLPFIILCLSVILIWLIPPSISISIKIIAACLSLLFLAVFILNQWKSRSFLSEIVSKT